MPNDAKEIIELYGRDILASAGMQLEKRFKQHGETTVYTHSLTVAVMCVHIANMLALFSISVNLRALVRGALLHDYFLYDWHFKDLKNPHKLHGFYHPSRALHNAQKEYTLTKRQEDIIKKHMWPLTVVPPMCREAWIVTAADKYCSFMETVHLHKGKIKTRKGILKIQSI